jgi:hypothetical protein
LSNRTDYAFTSPPNIGSSAVVAADFDDDGDEDLLVCRPGDEELTLYRLSGDMYTPDTGVFANLTDRRVLKYVQCATWVDFDHNGDLDLYLGRGDGDRPKTDALLEYNASTGTFYDVAAATGLEPGPTFGSTTSAAWADFDNDGLWDIVRTTNGQQGLSTQRLRQTGPDSTFVAVASGLPSSISQGRNSEVQWVDVDRDNDLDLVFIAATAFGENTATVQVCRNEDGTFAEPELIGFIPRSGVLCPYDYDLDGWPDFIASGGTSAQLIANLQGLSEVYPDYPDYLDVSAATGLGSGEDIGSVLATDLNRDGDLDVVLGRRRTAQAPKVGLVMASQQPDATDNPASHWIGLRIEAAVGYTPLGATVALSKPAGEPLGIQVVDGGGSSAFQRSRDLVFGLGDYEGAVNVEIRWPHWASSEPMEFTLAASYIDSYTTIEEFTGFTVNLQTITHSLVWDPYLGTFDWVFRWNTDHWTEPAKDCVELARYMGSGCEPNLPKTLRDTGGDDVSSTITYEDGVFKHEVRWLNRDCFAVCGYSYSIQSALGRCMCDPIPGRTRIKFLNCPSQY